MFDFQCSSCQRFVRAHFTKIASEVPHRLTPQAINDAESNKDHESLEPLESSPKGTTVTTHEDDNINSQNYRLPNILSSPIKTASLLSLANSTSSILMPLLPTANQIRDGIMALNNLSPCLPSIHSADNELFRASAEGEKKEAMLEASSINELPSLLDMSDSQVNLPVFLCTTCLATLELQTTELCRDIRDEILLHENALLELPEISSDLANEGPKCNQEDNNMEILLDAAPSNFFSTPTEDPSKNVEEKQEEKDSFNNLANISSIYTQHLAVIEKLDADIWKQEVKSDKIQLQLRQLEEKIQELGCEFVESEFKLTTMQQEIVALEAEVHYKGRLASHFSQINVINESFHIWTEGHYGTINGLRLGKRPNDNVSWEEINAAWGQAVYYRQLALAKADRNSNLKEHGSSSSNEHLITDPIDSSKLEQSTIPLPGQSSSVSTPKQAKYQEEIRPSTSSLGPPRSPQLQNLQSYRILPRGSQTVILRRSDGSLFELYGVYGGLSRFFAGRRFDQAMILFLGLTSDLISLAALIGASAFQIADWSLSPPYKIASETVGGYPIHLSSSSGDEAWSRCLKCLLIDVKWITGVVDHLSATIESNTSSWT